MGKMCIESCNYLIYMNYLMNLFFKYCELIGPHTGINIYYLTNRTSQNVRKTVISAMGMYSV